MFTILYEEFAVYVLYLLVLLNKPLEWKGLVLYCALMSVMNWQVQKFWCPRPGSGEKRRGGGRRICNQRRRLGLGSGPPWQQLPAARSQMDTPHQVMSS